MTTAYTYINGERVDIPQNFIQARKLGWHRAGPDCINVLQEDEIFQWCRQTFAGNSFGLFAEYSHTYGRYQHYFWFLYEQDAVLCNLRWA